MGKYDFVEEPSDSDNDDSLQEDIAALSAACLPSTNPKIAYSAECSDDDGGDDDLELVRSIKEQYGIGDDISHPLSLKPLTTLPPVDSDDEEDDFETLRAIQRRFSQYSDGDDRDAGSNGDTAGAGCAASESKSETYIPKSSVDDAIYLNLGNVCRNDPEQGPCSTSEFGDTSSHTSSFPNSAQNFIEAIKKNRSCQKFLRSKLLHIETRMEEIKTLQKKVKILKGYQVQCKKKIGRALSQKQDARIQLISARKQRLKEAEKNISPICYGPMENSHVANYRASLTNFPLSFQREKWSSHDRKKLEKGIVQQLQKVLIEKSAGVLSDLGESQFVNGWDEIMSSVKNFEITPEVIQDFAGKVNWEELASMYLPCRSGAESEARWLNYENRLINKDDWTQTEDKQLLLLIQHYGINNWGLVAQKLKTNRTPFQCLARYQRSLNASIMKREWTEDEDVQLRSAVESSGESNWTVVASALEGRTATQCSNRWNKTLHPSRKRVGKWSDDEDKRLKVAVTLFGQKNWYRIAQFVPGRTQVQCRERWVNVLDPSLKRSEWTEEEDLKLKEAIVEHGYCWSRIAACVPPRTDNQCRRRWKRLFPHEVPLLQAAKRIQNVALISNFVDRESERPALGPKDFVLLSIEGSINELGNDNFPQKMKSRRSRKSESCREETSGNTSKEALSKKCPKKRGRKPKCPAVGWMNDHVDTQSKSRPIILTYQRRKTNKPASKEIECGENIDVAAKPKRKPRDTSKKIGVRKCRKRARSPDIGMISDVTDAGHSDGDEVIKNKLTHKSGLKKRKLTENIDMATKCENKSSGSRRSDDTVDIEPWDMPIRIWSRRARGVQSKKSAPLTSCTVLKGTKNTRRKKNKTAREPSLEENPSLSGQCGLPPCSNSDSKMVDNEEARLPSVDDLTSNRSSLNSTLLEDGSSIGHSVISACNNAEGLSKDASKSINRKFTRKLKQSKLQRDQSEKWEHLPLAALQKIRERTVRKQKIR